MPDPATPADAIEEAMRHMGVDGPEDAATVVLGALAERGMVVVSAEDLRAYLNRGSDLKREVEAMNRLRAALPERTPDA